MTKKCDQSHTFKIKLFDFYSRCLSRISDDEIFKSLADSGLFPQTNSLGKWFFNFDILKFSAPKSFKRT